MNKMFCKLFGHKWENASYIRVCRRCPKIEWRSKNNRFMDFSLAGAIEAVKKIRQAFRSLGTSARKL